jgi:NhaP-type Na+/H+ or K+/H+ antiporter
VRIRQTINVESGLNDGIALPAVLFIAALAGAHHGAESASGWINFIGLQLVVGPAVGLAIGYVGARLIDETAQRNWASTTFQGIAILALAVLSFSVAELVGGNGFIAAFVSGMVFGHVIRHACAFLFEFMESEGQLLTLITFLIFGAVLLPEGLANATPATFAYALLSLTVIRMLPVALSLLGTGVSLPTQLFLGWFGPRGLASILFVLLILEESSMLHKDTLLSTTVITVALSVVLHGISAAPLARAYGRLADAMGTCTENESVSEMPLRHGNLPESDER